jgi:hypothetical protein
VWLDERSEAEGEADKMEGVDWQELRFAILTENTAEPAGASSTDYGGSFEWSEPDRQSLVDKERRVDGQ